MPRRSTELLQEFIVIVIGVFVALAAESWWSEREDRRIEREFREDIVAEFEANIRILEEDLAANGDARPRMAILEGLSNEALMALSDQQLTGIFYPNFDWNGFDPALGTVQALVQSGNLAVVSDREMRLGLARWVGLLESNRRFNLQAGQFEQREVVPFVARAAADERWSAVERHELQIYLSTFLQLFDTTADNQRQLLATARDILAFLQESD